MFSEHLHAAVVIGEKKTSVWSEHLHAAVVIGKKKHTLRNRTWLSEVNVTQKLSTPARGCRNHEPQDHKPQDRQTDRQTDRQANHEPRDHKSQDHNVAESVPISEL